MSVRLKSVVRFAVMTAGVVLTAAPAFAWYSGGGGGCWGSCGGGTSVPEPSTLALLGVAIPGAAAWIKHKLF
ncbi:MAG: PEP-CTERM sorting domain-containing protein [Alphaproteobacteria bacterium]|jgi:PEP-CTERM motif|nr:PEP-CTERM sorting domain-containing protein [Alphaproteobacteria bacterium]